MKLTHFEAKGVHGYLGIDIEFFPELTFLTGLNGSGKTTALRLLMGLLGPDLAELGAIVFESVRLVVSDGNKEVVLEARKTPEGFELSTSALQTSLSVSAAEMEILLEQHHSDEVRVVPVLDKLSLHPVYKSIARMSTPMFLGLDRRFFTGVDQRRGLLRHRVWEMEQRRRPQEHRSIRTSPEASLSDVNYLVTTALTQIRAQQERLDEQLRIQILVNAFRYAPPTDTSYEAPTRPAIEQYRKRLTAVKRAAAGLRLPVGEVESELTSFFERMQEVVAEVEKISSTEREKRKKKDARKHDNKQGQLPQELTPVVLEWLLNRAQTDRILNNIERLEAYGRERYKLHEPIDRFLALVNGFLEQTNKRVSVQEDSSLGVFINEEIVSRPLYALSSGERQLIIMLAHLSLNPRLSGSGVFIVDEPELSLHIGWQERFVESIREANPAVQLIMATHSPAIILDKLSNCWSLSKAGT